MSTLCTTVDCINNLIIVDACSGGMGLNSSYPFDITFPDGTTSTMNNSLPFSFTFTLQGYYTIYSAAVGDGSIVGAKVQCGKGGPGGKGNPCDSIAGISSCVFSLNERYEELKCNNDKKAEEEKIKLDRVIQLLSLAENDCECGKGPGGIDSTGRPGPGGPVGMVYEYIDEINSIANCDDCDKDFSIGGGGDSSASGCTDPLAFNYNDAATQDDGSCIYSQDCVDVTMLDGTIKSETLIPDPFFEAWLENQGYGNGALDGKVCTVNLKNETVRVDIDGSPLAPSITNLTGIEDFENVVGYFNVSNIAVSSLDLSNSLPSLSMIYANFMPNLTLADVSGANNLTQLQMVTNPNLTKIILGSNINLATLNLHVANNHSSLEISVGTSIRKTQAEGIWPTLTFIT